MDPLDLNPSRSVPSSSTDPAPQTNALFTPPRPYDVFLNHRGPDVKKSLASSIYHWLHDKGLRVFLDKEEFQVGDGLHPTIQQAISSSSVHIAIFSKRYAESSWCLDELCLILESGAKIIPVFYDHIRPSDLRWIGEGKVGEYAEAFAEHQRKCRYPSERLSKWKEALQKVSYLYGLELHGEEFQGDCGKLLSSIANAVLEAVAEKMPQESPKDAIGLHEVVEDFREFMQREAQPSTHEAVKIVGIVGIGGSGKTTLARRFYNIRRSSFSASSFLSEVRHAAAQQNLQSLQGKLLKDLFHIDDRHIEKGSVIDGRETLERRLRSSTPRVLIVLDDIDHEDQIESLVIKEVLGSGSLILVTARDKGPLIKSWADLIYQIKPLNKNHARELLCRHAFGQARPKAGFEDFAEKFCEKCRGLPLFLKVMGAHLRAYGDDDKDVWKQELECIPVDIEKMLQISYNALREEEKQIFMDIACFFLGWNKSTAIRVWNKSDSRCSTRLKNLEYRCLVEVDHKNRLGMHDHLRDFGREIAGKEPQCRFWHSRQIANIREELKGRRDVRGIMAASSVVSPQSTFRSVFLEIELASLKLLAIRGDCFETQFGQRATNLAWLRWFDFPHTSIPSWLISLQNLTVLELRSGRLEEWPVCDKQLLVKELVIQCTELSKISFPEHVWPQLEHLDLCGNQRLKMVEHLPATLLVLNLDGCTMLERITGSFNMPRLQKLRISGCSKLLNLPNLSVSTSLETLQVDCCYELRGIQGLEHLCKLKQLSISSCLKLDELPNLSGLTSLESLVVDRCDLPAGVQGLEHLRNLKKLSIFECSMLQGLLNLSGLISLEMLQADGCTELKSIQGLEHLRNLKKLSISECSMLQGLLNLSGLISLEMLQADGCTELKSIQGLEHLRKLQKLSISKCSMLQGLLNLSGLISLEMLQADCCTKLKSIQGLEHLRKLQKLSINLCYQLDKLSNLSGLTSLETLEAHSCRKLRDIRGLEHLCKLKKLNVSSCSELRSLPNLSGLTSLETLDARDCIRLQKIRGAEHLVKLEHLNICRCSELDELSNLCGLNSLKTLEAEGCWKLQSIDGLDQLDQLALLTLSAANGDRAILKCIQHMKKLPSKLLVSVVGAGSNALNIPGLPVSEFRLSGEAGCWKSEMHASTCDGNPCDAILVCHVVESIVVPRKELRRQAIANIKCASPITAGRVLPQFSKSERCFQMSEKRWHLDGRHRAPRRWRQRVDYKMGDGKWVFVAVFPEVEAPDLTSTFHWCCGFLRGIQPTKGCMMGLANGNEGRLYGIIQKLLG